MTIAIEQAAKYLFEKSGKTLTEVELQRLIYLAHCWYLGTYNKPLIDSDYEAWENGPVSRDLWQFIHRCNDKYFTPARYL